MGEEAAYRFLVDLPVVERDVDAAPAPTVRRLQAQVDRRRDLSRAQKDVDELE
jgi:hypothetical protein